MKVVETRFIETVWKFYEQHGRHDLPWRKTTNSYKIVVSELMLQQTQVSRVIPKYTEFLERFPTARQLAAVPLGDVLIAWQGLGYNRRAKYLWQAARVVIEQSNGRWPKTLSGLKKLPGVGAYTAGAVMNFAYNKPVPLIETNVRTVYLHHFFAGASQITDSELLPIVERTLSFDRPREWNWALMDYGSYLKSASGNANVRSASYKKQSVFKESNRFIRGSILKLLKTAYHSEAAVIKTLVEIEKNRVKEQLNALIAEGMVIKEKRRYRLP